MVERRIGCLPVTCDGALQGLLTETDVLGWVARLQDEGEAVAPRARATSRPDRRDRGHSEIDNSRGGLVPSRAPTRHGSSWV